MATLSPNRRRSGLRESPDETLVFSKLQPLVSLSERFALKRKGLRENYRAKRDVPIGSEVYYIYR